MKNKCFNLAFALLASAFIFASCSKDVDTPQLEAPERSTVDISLPLDIEEEEIIPAEEDAPRAMTYDLAANKTPNKTYPHPSMTLNLEKGDKPALHLVLVKSDGSKRHIAKNVDWTYDAKTKQIKVRKLPVNIPNADFGGNKDWKVFCVLGGNGFDTAGNLKFQSKTSLPPAKAGQSIALNALYMSTNWVDLEHSISEGNHYLNAKTGQKSKLKSQTTTIMCRLGNSSTDKVLHLRGFHLATSSMSFAGTYNLKNLAIGSQPAYTPTVGSNFETFTNANIKETVNAGKISDYYLCMGIPTAAKVSLRVTPLFGNLRVTRARFIDYVDKDVKKGSYVGINKMIYAKRELVHPIEAVLMDDADAGTVHVAKESTTITDAQLSGGTIRVEGEDRRYNLPSIYQLAVLVPGMRGGGTASNLGSGAWPILDFQKGNDYSTTSNDEHKGSNRRNPEKEKIAAWASDTYREYDAEFRGANGHRNPTNVYYGLRFIGSENYLSAYRYEWEYTGTGNNKEGKRLKITVRTLKHAPRTTIEQITKESFWKEPLAWNQSEYKVNLDQGMYWSKTNNVRDWSAGQTIFHLMKIFANRAMDQVVANPTGAYVSDPTRSSFGDNPSHDKNTHSKVLLFTTDGGFKVSATNPLPY